MTVKDADESSVRVVTRPDFAIVVTHARTSRQAVVRRRGAFWVVEMDGVASEFTACDNSRPCPAPKICRWPVPSCFHRADKHFIKECHHWHAPRAVVTATVLLAAVADGMPQTRERPRWARREGPLPSAGRRYSPRKEDPR